VSELATHAPDARRQTPLFVKIVWGIALVLIAVLFAFGEFDLTITNGAPQQAAAAAMACFRLIAVYTFARAVQGVSR
jgi:Na+-driven multidrug efflux pump